MNDTSDLTHKHCIPCEGGVPSLTHQQVSAYADHIPGWEIVVEKELKIRRKFSFKSFNKAIEFVNEVATLAEQEHHHPDILINYNKVTLILWTHAIGGLSENDMILAAKIQTLLEDRSKIIQAPAK